ncbi:MULTISPECIES: tetratricopeptide repeat protein [unclassified Acidovorax]|uniref:tetratricopeptide repeat protein n=1 Tax=unclassified Acidovorax TaxID=2684926 RepID=UPI001C46FD97|nr:MULTISPECIES: tetratricopeptide repeat protein [unclassified Acidovorax]MBV7430827.1 tetratricopeptide repeat protein [Acidovorax sp. sif0732]MBV7451933.1 tetratricopeptide repeat protein [Acidovorax sp. sif0715]
MSIHYNLGGRPPRTTKAQHAALLEQAMRLHRLGHLAQANQAYNTILQTDSRNTGALHMLGVLAYQTGHHEAACDLIGQAIDISPQDPAPYVNRGLALSALKRSEEALAHFGKAIALRPDFAEAYVNRGKILAELSRTEEAIESYDRAIGLQPRLAAAYNNKGNALRHLGHLGEALQCYEQAFALDGRHVDACQNMATLHAEAGRSEDALGCFDKLIALQPGHAAAHNGKGVILAQREQRDQAIAHFQAAIHADEKYVQAYKNLARAQYSASEFSKAAQSLKTAAQLQPEDVEILSLLALSLTSAGRYAESMAVYDEAIRLAAEAPDLYYNRANLRTRFGQHEDAVADYLAVYDAKPDVKYLLGYLVNSRLKTCDWAHLSSDLERCDRSLRAGELTVQPFVALALFDTPELHKRAAQIRVEFDFPQAMDLGPTHTGRREAKIRVGYYSADFHGHATAYLMAELFEAHDRDRFEWFAFSFGPHSQDAMRERLAASFDHFVDVRDQGDIDIARLSRELGIDIAIDLKGFTTDNRFGIFAHRCAPIQVSYLGYPGTTGAGYMDYVIADKVVVPPEAQAYFTEKLAYLPHSYQVNDSKRTISDRIFTREEVGLPSTGFVFCCFNNNYKILPSVFDSWMRILQAVPGSVLWLYEDNPAVVGNLRREAQARGVAAERLVFAQRMPLDLHLARHRLAGLFLDTLPYNAHTTASDALWAGLPVLTRLGESFAARVAASLLQAVGLPELVTRSVAEYEALAITLACDLARLQALRDKLNAQKTRSSLFNARQFARDIEAAYVAMYERKRKGLPPEVIEV